MVANIIDVVELKYEEKQFPQEFAELLWKNAHSFASTIYFIDGFAKDRGIVLPETI